MSNFSPLCQLQLSISQNRPVLLVPHFVGVHHKCVNFTVQEVVASDSTLITSHFTLSNAKVTKCWSVGGYYQCSCEN